MHMLCPCSCDRHRRRELLYLLRFAPCCLVWDPTCIGHVLARKIFDEAFGCKRTSYSWRRYLSRFCGSLDGVVICAARLLRGRRSPRH